MALHLVPLETGTYFVPTILYQYPMRCSTISAEQRCRDDWTEEGLSTHTFWAPYSFSFSGETLSFHPFACVLLTTNAFLSQFEKSFTRGHRSASICLNFSLLCFSPVREAMRWQQLGQSVRRRTLYIIEDFDAELWSIDFFLSVSFLKLTYPKSTALDGVFINGRVKLFQPYK